MSQLDNESVHERLERLERLVEELGRRLPPRPADAAAPASAAAATERSAEPERRGIRAAVSDRAREWMPDDGASPFSWDGQTWLNRLGIVLLLLGVALLFRYSIDMGWLTPAVRVGFGAAVGAVLTALGLRMDERRRFGSVLLGGGIAAFYLTGWAAFNLYSLIGYTAAFTGMVAITAGAFTLAMWRSQPALAIVGAFGGLGTPLILGISYAAPRGLALYTSAVLAWTVVPYLRRGWRSVLWTSMAFGWVLLASYANAFSQALAASASARVWMQGAAVFAWIVLGVLPLARRVASIAAAPRTSADGESHEKRWRDGDALHWYGVSIASPAAFLVTTALVWRMGAAEWGVLAAIAAGVYAAAARALWRADGRLARVLLFAAAVLLPAGCFGALESETLLVALAAQALALHLLSAYGAGRAIRWLAHRGFTAVGAWVLFRLVENADVGPARVAADLAAIAAGFAISYVVRTRGEMLSYRIWAHVAVLGWVWRQLAQLEGGQGYATIVWGTYALGLLLLALRQRWPTAERVAIWTLLATVAKLFLVDLERLDPLFRVLLFLGFGAVFLYFSYSLSGAWKPRAEPEPKPRPAGRDA
ncbi:MAG TPA: DUF2339 domain-containing protein [Longimicrobium sp.]|nr:DUF2339 domain-containing protein [Longimicrobium sp.]